MDLNCIHNMNCLDGMKTMDSRSIDLIITSPPYYNAREYSKWDSLTEYFDDMQKIFTEVYRTLKNHHYLVVTLVLLL